MGRDPVGAGWSRRQFLRDATTTGLITMSGLLGAPASAGAALAGARVVYSAVGWLVFRGAPRAPRIDDERPLRRFDDQPTVEAATSLTRANTSCSTATSVRV